MTLPNPASPTPRASAETTLLHRAGLSVDNPWPGADSFRTEDAEYFRGRRTEISELLQLLSRARCVTLFGASGLGKSSLIQAGVVPKLPDTSYFAVPIRISYVAGAHSVGEQIQTEIVRHAGKSHAVPPIDANGSAWEYLHRRSAPFEERQPLLIFDQFEELFTVGAQTPQAGQLVEELAALIEGVPPQSVRERLELHPEESRAYSFQQQHYRILISIREDFLYGLESLRRSIPSIIHNRYGLKGLNGKAAMEVVTQVSGEPPNRNAPQNDVRPPLVASDVAEIIVRTVAAATSDARQLDALEVEPVLLSILCNELARRRTGRTITAELVTGNRAEIIANFYERALEDMPLTVREFIEDELVTATGFRGSALIQEALTVPGMSEETLRTLVNRRLLRPISRSNRQWLELAHDILAEVAARKRALRQERQRAEERLQEERQRAEAAARAERERAEARALKERRFRNTVATIASFVLCIGALYYYQNRRALDASVLSKRTLRTHFVDSSLSLHRYREALAQLADAVKEDASQVWARALAGDLLLHRGWALPIAPMFPAGPFTSIDCNRARTRCAAAYRDGRVLVRGDLELRLDSGHAGYGQLQMSSDGDRLLFMPECSGSATRWTGINTKQPAAFRFDASTTMPFWDASDNLEVIALSNRDHGWTLQLAGSSRLLSAYGESVAVSMNGRWVAYQTQDKSLALEDLTTSEIKKITTPTDQIAKYIRFDPESKVLLAAFSDRSVRRWMVEDGSETYKLDAERVVQQLSFSADAKHIVAALEGGGVQLWSDPWIESTKLLDVSGGIHSLDFSVDGEWLVAAGRDGTIRLWSTSGTVLAESIRRPGYTFARTLPDHRLITGSLPGDSAAWQIPHAASAQSYSLDEPLIKAWFTSEDAFYAVGEQSSLEQTIGGEAKTDKTLGHNYVRDRSAYLQSFRERTYLYRQPDWKRVVLIDSPVEESSFSDDSKRVVVLSNNKASIFDLETAKQIGDAIEPASHAWVNADGSVIATSGFDMGVTLWAQSAGKWQKREVLAPGVVPDNVTFDAASKHVAISSANQVQVWDRENTSAALCSLSHGGPTWALRFSPDGRWLATGSADKKARVWHVADGLPATDWFVHSDSVSSVDFSPSGKTLLTAARDGTLYLWKVLRTADASQTDTMRLAELAEIVSGLRVAPENGEVIATANRYQDLDEFRRQIESECATDKCKTESASLLRDVLESRQPSGAEAH